MAYWKQLEDVEETARKYPESFFIPKLRKRKTQRSGDSVRLHFLLESPEDGEPSAERMWVTVTRACGVLTAYLGRLENDPAFIQNLKAGDEVRFKPCHIARVTIKRDDPEWIDSSEQKALVSKMCLERDQTVRFLYRQQPDRAQDSGWRMFSGTESQEYNDDPKNIAIVDVGWILDRDPTLLEPLKEGIGAVFERTELGDKWARVHDWIPEE
jgi:hypothetical protein